jgi:tight adherence protein B
MKIIICFTIFAAVAIAVYYQKQIIKKLSENLIKYKNSINEIIKASLIKVRKDEIFKIEAAVIAVFIAIFLLTMNVYILVMGIISAIAAPKIYINLKQQKYLQEYYNQLPDFIESILGSLKAGLSIIKAMQVKAEKNDGAISAEINIVLKKIDLGQSLTQAMNELKARVPLKENEIFVAAINTAIETGGNISHVLENILVTLRKREELKRELKTMTSQGVLSGIIVGLLPVFLLVIIFFIDPQFVTPLFTTTTGNMLLLAALCLEAIGSLFIKKIITIN